MKKAILIFFSALLILYITAKAIPADNYFKPEDEYLEYNAFWGFINLGSIKVWTNAKGDYIKSRFQLDSSPWLFFINVHYEFESEFSIDSLLDARFLIYETMHGEKVVTIFEKKHDKIIATQKKLQTGEIIKVIEKDTRNFYNGITAFYLTRKLLGTNQKLTIPILIQLDVKDVELNFHPENSTINFFNSSVKTKKISGFIPFVTEDIAGLTGDFYAYYSDDSARIPIKAYFKTFLGNVRVELVKWNRGKWQPPQFADKK
jgi:hypothetical protein